jgi:signal peptidase I
MSERLKAEIKETAESLVIAVILALIIRAFIVQAFYIPSGSMEPTLNVGDRILVSKFIYHFRQPVYGDVVVFKFPGDTSRDFIKRVVGLPGDVISVSEGKLHRNGKPITEEYIKERIYYDFGPVEVPPGNLFVMGDNRNNSNDSHEWGTLPRANLLGKALVVYWPMLKMRAIR